MSTSQLVQLLDSSEDLDLSPSTIGRHFSELITLMYETPIPYRTAVDQFRTRWIAHVLTESKGNKCTAAKKMGMHRNTLGREMQRLGMDADDYKPRSR